MSVTRLRQVFAAAWPPVLFGAVLLWLWEMGVRALDWKPFFVPAPSKVWDAFTSNTTLIREAAWVSGGNALVGLLVGTIAGDPGTGHGADRATHAGTIEWTRGAAATHQGGIGILAQGTVIQ